MTRTWDIFCSVVDNYGDIGVCWRLARQLSSELKQSVRLWVDDLASFQHLCAGIDPGLTVQFVEAVEVRRWSVPFNVVGPADVVIEGFGVRLPDVYINAMAARQPRPVWINLEYLSAEKWVEGCHGLPSPHPGVPLVKYFFFPGFTPATGGLLMESGLAQARDSFQGNPEAVAAYRRSLGLVLPEADALWISLFCYDNAALPALMEAWISETMPVICVATAGAALTQLSRIAGRQISAGSRVDLGSLSIQAIPFLELDRYDRLLWACDVNFVRGEDSFIRAQLAARPLIWQAYPQEEGTHVQKASAFLERYTSALSANIGVPYRALMQAWNRESAEVGEAWVALRPHRAALAFYARDWAGQLARGGNLAFTLAEFCEDRLE